MCHERVAVTEAVGQWKYRSLVVQGKPMNKFVVGAYVRQAREGALRLMPKVTAAADFADSADSAEAAHLETRPTAPAAQGADR